MILGYASDFSVIAGQSVDFHFSADADGTRARIHFYRFGVQGHSARWIHVGMSSPQMLDHFPRGSFGQSWGWPVFTWPVPSGWPSGVYVAVALPARMHGRPPDPESRRLEQVLFVVRPSAPGLNARILYKVPFFTYAAYNGSWLQDSAIGANSLYQVGPVTAHRPGVGTDPWDSEYVDFEDPASLRQTFIHWDAKMVAWLQKNGYAIEYCTDLDVHRDGSFLGNYCLLLSAGHDEYWTEAMRANVESFVTNGGNVAFFSGNTAWWRTMASTPPADLVLQRLDNWPSDHLETGLTGVSYRHGSGRWSVGQREAIGYTVQHSGHWLFEQTGLVDGAVFGAPERLVGYEGDGTALVAAVPGEERTPSFIDGTPASFVVLGFAQTPGWDEPLKGNEPTMGVYTNGGIVFTAATTDWPRVLGAGQAEVVQITKNVLDRLATTAMGIKGPITPGACKEHVAVVDGAATFFAANVPSGATLEWRVAGGQIDGPDNQAKLVVVMPSTPDLVTVWVTVTVPGKSYPGFGTLTIRPLTVEAFEWVQMACDLRRLVIGATAGKHAISGGRNRVPFSVDPLWDPLHDGYFHLGANQLRSLRQQATGLARAIETVSAVRLARKAKPIRKTAKGRGRRRK